MYLQSGVLEDFQSFSCHISVSPESVILFEMICLNVPKALPIQSLENSKNRIFVVSGLISDYL